MREKTGRNKELRRGQLTWRMTARDEACVCSCGSEKFFFVRTVIGEDCLEDESFDIICCSCGAKYPV
jgi:hypothetical protein